MCMEVFAVPVEANKVSARRLSDVSGLRVAKRDLPVKNAMHFSIDGGCSCSLLGESADWEAATWDLVPEILDGLARALETLHAQAGGFTFRALWIGEKAETEACVPLEEVLRDVRANRIRNKHAYKVERAG